MRVSSRLAGRRARVTGFSALRPGLVRPSLPGPEPPVEMIVSFGLINNSYLPASVDGHSFLSF